MLSHARLAGHEYATQAGEFALDFDRHRPVVETADPVRDHVGGRTGGAHEVADFRVPVGAQGHHGNRANARQGEVGVDELGAIGQLHHHPVQGLDARLKEAAGESIRGFHQVPVTQALVSADEGGLFRVAPGAARQHLRNGDALPPAAGAVTCRLIGGPGHTAFEHRSSPWYVRVRRDLWKCQ